MPIANLDKLSQVAGKEPASLSSIRPADEGLIQQAINYLSSAEAEDSIAVDAYWPKWNGPWWHLMLLHEMGMAKRIPTATIESVFNAIDRSCLKFFPYTEQEVPAGVDPLRQVVCHCQLGCLHRLLHDHGFAVDQRMPWVRRWYLDYQLPDGGLNCDEAAYTRPVPKSSVVSTLPPLEAVLQRSITDELSDEEKEFLDRGAQYLMSKRLFRSNNSGRVIDESWLELTFPRFYHYDILRGLSFVLKWARLLGRQVPGTAIIETVEYIDNSFPDGFLRVQRAAWSGASTRWFDRKTSTWTRKPAESFPLLDSVSELGRVSRDLTEIWDETRADLQFLIKSGQIT